MSAIHATPSSEVHSVWFGSVSPEPCGAVEWLPGHDEELRSLVVDQRRPLVIVARNSGKGGRAYFEAAKELHECAEDFKRRFKVDITSALPSRDQAEAWLAASPNVTVRIEAGTNPPRSFTTQSVLVDLSSQGLILMLTAGSAKKMDTDHEQPSVQFLYRVLREVEPGVAGFFTKRWDRFARRPYPTGRVLAQLRDMERALGAVWAADALNGRMRIDSDADMNFFSRGLTAQKDADTLARKRVTSSITLSDTKMVDGRAARSIGGGVPPGLMTYHDHDTGQTMLVIDEPRQYKSGNGVGTGRPTVTMPDGSWPNQAKTVRWFLKNLGKEDVTVVDLAQGLVDRRFSTSGLRMRKEHKSGAYYGGPTRPFDGTAADAWNIVNTILLRLDFYKTGTLKATFGQDFEDEHVTVTNCFPSAKPRKSNKKTSEMSSEMSSEKTNDGTTTRPWASQEDFDRIDAWMANRGWSSPPHSRTRTWSGLEVELDGLPATLQRRQRRRSDDSPEWVLTMPQEVSARRDPTLPLKGGVPAIPDEVLTGAVVGAVVAAHGEPLVRFVTPEGVILERDRLLATREGVVAEMARQQGLADRSFALIHGTKKDKTPMLTSPELIAESEAEWLRRKAMVAELGTRIVSLDRQLEAGVDAGLGVGAAALTRLLRSLLDPGATPAKDELRRGVQNLRFVSRKLRSGGREGVEVSFSGELAITTSTGVWTVPFSGVHESGPAAASVERERGLQALAYLRAGNVETLHCMRGRIPAVMWAARALGVTTGKFPLWRCEDEALMRVSMAVLFPEPAEGEDAEQVPDPHDVLTDPALAAAFGDVDALVAAVRAAAQHKGPAWLGKSGGLNEVTAVIRSACGNLEATDETDRRNANAMKVVVERRGHGHRWRFPYRQRAWPEIVPCAFCGSRWCVPSRMREVTGYLCLECRRDETGLITWPARFDRFVAHEQLLRDSGAPLSTGPDAGPETGAETERRRRASVPRIRPSEDPVVISTVTAPAI